MFYLAHFSQAHRKFEAFNIDLKLNKTSFSCENNGGRSLAWFRTSACHAEDPGSNPGDRISVVAFFGSGFCVGTVVTKNNGYQP